MIQAVKDRSQKKRENYAKFFPTMVKFGVPMPAATWALSAGIPLRKSAIEIGRKFSEQTNNQNFKEFGE